MAEERLTGKARGEDVGVELRVAFPGPYGFELEHATAEVRAEHALVERFDRRQTRAIDLVEAAQVAGQRAALLVDAVTAQVLEQVIVRVHAVQRRVCRVRFVEIPKEVIDEMRKWF